MKLRMRICAALLAITLLCTSFGTLALEGDDYSSSEQQLILSVQTAMQQSAAYMLNPVGSYYPENGLSFGTLQGDWAAFALGRSGLAIPYDIWQKYADNSSAAIVRAIEKVRAEHSNITTLPLLHYRKRTENMRAIIGYTSLGFNVHNVSGYDITRALGNYTDIVWQGINATMFTLIALDTLDYDMPQLTGEEMNQGVHGTAVQATREMLVARLMSQELPGGGWMLDTGFEIEDGGNAGSFTPSTDRADPDITAMTIQALARYRNATVTVNGSEKRVGDAIERGLNVLSALQRSAGDFDSWGTANVESTAQVLMALMAMGIDPLKDERFITPSGNTLINGILRYHVAGSGFRHVIDGSVNAIATDQAMYALVAYDRFLKGKNYIYNMSDNAEAHAISIDALEHGTLSAADGASQGQRVAVYASPDDGYTLSDVKAYLYQSEIDFDNGAMRVSWELTPTYQQAAISGDGLSASFIMPNVPVLIRAEFGEGGQTGESYGFIQTSVNGSVRVSKESAKEGEKVLISPKPLEGYEYAQGTLSAKGPDGESLTLTRNNSGGWEFTMPNGSVTLYAEFNEVETIGHVTVSIEKFTLGQGYVIEPVQAELYKNDSVANVITRLLTEHGMEYTLGSGASVEKDFYLAAITDGSDPNKPINPPQYIVDAINKEGGKLEYTRSGVSLGEHDYAQKSGWMYSVNGAYPNYAASDFRTASGINPLKDGDVIRWQFTLWGYGLDIGGGLDGDESSGPFEQSYVNIADRTAATSSLADAKSNYPSWIAANEGIYYAALNTMANLTVSESALNDAIAPIRAMLAANKDEFRIILPNNAAANGHRISAISRAAAGDDITVTVIPADGYELCSSSLKANGVKISGEGNTYSFVMPAADVAITAGFCKSGTGAAAVKGDANGDGSVNIADVVLICRCIMGEAQLDADAIELCDMNEDGGINVTDAVLICMKIVEAVPPGEGGTPQPENPNPPKDEPDDNELSGMRVYLGSAAPANALLRNGTDSEAEYPTGNVFERNKYNYDLGTVGDIVKQLRFKLNIADGAKATLHYTDLNGNAATKDATNSSVNAAWIECIKPGKNTVKVVITPPAGSTLGEKTYTLNLNCRPSLSALTITADGIDVYLNPAFNSKTYVYGADISASAETVHIEAKPVRSGCNITFNGQTDSAVDIKDTDTVIIRVEKDGIYSEYAVKLNKKAAYTAKFKTYPVDAAVRLKDDKNGVLVPNAEGIYENLLPGTEYTWFVTRNGYVTKTGKLNNPAQLTDGALSVMLSAAPASDLPNYSGEWPTFRNSPNNNAVTNAATPNSTAAAALKWAKKYGTSEMAGAVNIPIIVNDHIYIARNNDILCLSKSTGEVAVSGKLAARLGGSGTNPMTYAEGMLFVQLSGGRIQALRADTLQSLWITEVFGDQPVSPITYHNGYIYTGTWTSETGIQSFACFSVTDEDIANGFETKYATWLVPHAGGFYWAGAYVNDVCAVFGSDDGTNDSSSPTAVLYSVNSVTGSIIDTVNNVNGDIRSTVVYDSGRVYFTTKGGYLYSVGLNANGTFDHSSVKSIRIGSMSTGTPVIYKGRLYVGCSGNGYDWNSDSGSGIAVVNVSGGKLDMIYKAPTPGYPQAGPLLCTAFEAATGKVYVYTTYNNNPGGIYIIEDSAGQTKPSINNGELYIPEKGYRQYCISTICTDSEGTLYYKNDSGALIAVKNIDSNAPAPPSA